MQPVSYIKWRLHFMLRTNKTFIYLRNTQNLKNYLRTRFWRYTLKIEPFIQMSKFYNHSRIPPTSVPNTFSTTFEANVMDFELKKVWENLRGRWFLHIYTMKSFFILCSGSLEQRSDFGSTFVQSEQTKITKLLLSSVPNKHRTSHHLEYPPNFVLSQSS